MAYMNTLVQFAQNYDCKLRASAPILDNISKIDEKQCPGENLFKTSVKPIRL